MAKKSALAGRFTLAPAEVVKRTIASLAGEVGEGKTHFALTAPGPTLMQNIDKGTEGVIEKFRADGKEIYEEHYEWNPGAVDLDAEDDEEDNLKSEKELKEAAVETRNKWEKDAFYAMDNGIRSVIMDTESRIWQVYRYAEFGGPNGEQRDYDKLNLRFEGLINKAKSVPGVNLFLIRSMKDRWGMFGKVKADGSKSFGKAGREVWGYEHLDSCIFTSLTFGHSDEFKAENGTPNYIDVGKCRQSDELSWTRIVRMSFPDFGMEMMPETTLEDWSE